MVLRNLHTMCAVQVLVGAVRVRISLGSKESLCYVINRFPLTHVLSVVLADCILGVSSLAS